MFTYLILSDIFRQMRAREALELGLQAAAHRLSRIAMGDPVKPYEDKALRLYDPLTIVDVSIERASLDELDRLCASLWPGVTPTKNFGTSMFDLINTPIPSLVTVNEGFMQLRTRMTDAIPAATRLYPLLNDSNIKTTGMTLDVVGFASLPDRRDLDANAALLKPLRHVKEALWERAGFEVVGAGVVVFNMYKDTPYVLSVDPYPYDRPTHHMLVSVQTEHGGQVTPFGLRRMIEEQREYFDMVVQSLPQTLGQAA